MKTVPRPPPRSSRTGFPVFSRCSVAVSHRLPSALQCRGPIHGAPQALPACSSPWVAGWAPEVGFQERPSHPRLVSWTPVEGEADLQSTEHSCTWGSTRAEIRRSHRQLIPEAGAVGEKRGSRTPGGWGGGAEGAEQRSRTDHYPFHNPVRAGSVTTL